MSRRADSSTRPGAALVTIAVMLAVLLQVLDTTIANVALPHMQASLGATQETINWVLTSYIVASAIAMPITGWLADRVGRKRLFVIVGDRLHHRLGAVRDGAESDRDGAVPRAPGRHRRVHRAARPGDAVRHQPAARSTARRWRCSAAG